MASMEDLKKDKYWEHWKDGGKNNSLHRERGWKKILSANTGRLLSRMLLIT